MTDVIYTGQANNRILTSADLKSLGVEGFSKTTFPRRTRVEVDANIAKVLTEHKALSGEFAIASAREVANEGLPDTLETATDTPATEPEPGDLTTRSPSPRRSSK